MERKHFYDQLTILGAVVAMGVLMFLMKGGVNNDVCMVGNVVVVALAFGVMVLRRLD